jgi:protein phosphatase
MATTLTLAIYHPKGITMAHLGDSRIYYFRNNSILYQTRDHNLVNELVDNDIITPEEAHNSAQKHIITRAISAVASQSANPSCHLQADVQTGDLLFLCTDGVTESLSGDALSGIIRTHQHISEMIVAVEAACALNSDDNHSGIIIQIVDS